MDTHTHTHMHMHAHTHSSTHTHWHTHKHENKRTHMHTLQRTPCSIIHTHTHTNMHTRKCPPYASQSMLYFGKNLLMSLLNSLMAARSAATDPEQCAIKKVCVAYDCVRMLGRGRCVCIYMCVCVCRMRISRWWPGQRPQTLSNVRCNVLWMCVCVGVCVGVCVCVCVALRTTVCVCWGEEGVYVC